MNVHPQPKRRIGAGISKLPNIKGQCVVRQSRVEQNKVLVGILIVFRSVISVCGVSYSAGVKPRDID